MRLQDKVAIVTGATSGIGRETALLFAKEGANVILAGRRENLGNELVEEIRREGGSATFVQTDVTRKEDLKKLATTAFEVHGRIDILVNNAGVAKSTSFVEMDEAEDFDRLFDTNVKSYFLLTKEVLPYMLESKKGSIVNIASVAAEIGLPYNVSYSATKGAVRQFTKALAGEYAAAGIRVNAVLPGLTNSEMVPVGGEFEKMAMKSVPMGRAAKPYEIATGVLYLASDEASFCTGALLTIDGGTTSL